MEPVVQEIAKFHGATAHQILLAWPMAQNIAVIPKSENPERIRSNFEALNVNLSAEEVEKIGKLNRDKPYSKCRPWDWV